MSAAFGTQAFQQSRHARRIYVGGFPPNYGDEEALKFFLNSVIAKGLGEPNDNSYVLSIYVNQKKCFAFVELRAIELATACLDLDGIIYKKVVLKVLRANEYKPELIPPSMVGAPITLDLSSFSFGIPTATSNDKINVPSAQSSLTGVTTHPSASCSSDNVPDARLDSVIQFASLSYVSSGCISIVGYPFDDRAAPNYNTNSSSAKDAGNHGANGATPGGASNANNLTSHSSSNTSAAASVPAATTGSGSGGYTGLGCTQAPKKMRNMIRKYKFGLIQNPEYEVDLKKLKFIDVGDVQAGKTRDETKANLSAIVAEVVQRRAVPFVVGGSSDCAYYTAQGAMSASPRRVGMVVLSAQLDDTRILEDARMSGRNLPSQTTGIALPAAPGLGLVRENSNQSHNTSLPSESQHSAQVKSELDSPPGMERVLNCGGRYIRFAAQGLLCSTQQAEYVTSKGGHIVWLGRDIRNQSAQCSVCATATGDNFAPLAGRAVPHVYTLALFREALRCAAGVKDVELAQARAAAEKRDEEDHALPAIYRVESQDLHGRDAAELAPEDLAAASGESSPGSPLASPVGTPHGPQEKDSLLGGVVVSIDMGVLTGAVRGCGYITGSSSSATGLTIDEILDIVMIAGADPNVLSLDISEFSPDAEDSRSSMLLAQMFYQFSLGVASRPAHASSAAKSLGLGRAIPAVTSMDVDSCVGGPAMFETGAVMRVPFRVMVDRSSEQMQSRDLGSLSKTPKFYQEVSSGSMEAFTGTSAGPHGERGVEHTGGGANLPYVEVDHRLSSMDSLDISAMSESGNNSHMTYNKAGSSTNTSVSTKQQASPSHFVASPPTAPGSTSLSSSGSTDAFQKQLYPTGIPPQYVAHSQSQRAALQAADVAGLFGGMIRTSPAGTPTTTMRRLNSASAASPPQHPRVMTSQKSASAGMLGVGALYPNSAAMPRSSTSHLSQQQQHQQLFAQQALHLQQQQALYAQQRPGQQQPAYSRPPSAAQYGSSSASVPQGYPQQRSRYEPEQAWSGDRADPNQSHGRYAQHSSAQRQQLLHAQHQQQQLYRLQQVQQAQQQAQAQAQAQVQSPLDDRSASPQYLSQDFLDLAGDRMSVSVSSPGSSNNSYIGGLQGGGPRSSNNSTSSELSSALAGLGVGVSVSGSSELSLSGPNSASDKSRGAIGGRGNANLSSSNLNELHGSFDETMDMYEYRLAQQQQQQQQAPRRALQGPPAQGPGGGGGGGGYLQPSTQQNPGSLVRGSGANQTYTQSNSMYGLYNSSASNNTSFSTAEALSFASGSGSTLNQDLMSSLSSGGSASVLFLNNNAASHSHSVHSAPAQGQGPGQGQGHLSSPAARNSELDAPSDFMSEHYSQYS